ncbi:DUF1810 domain-containing protein [uncultured Nitratireductor sp.]|uniref:DUF1810 domain-containing protein n=1 Tax=uncultured Nitratireductor sp. TaxID=520953 RepID=UPI00262FD422|nr:DUF1810 domain-containing protein [uncultured Nitratireductor sp.]
MTEDPFDLQRFVTAQADCFDEALRELRAGRKRTHWMWFVFPQLRELGRSPTALFYGLVSLDEARAYLVHPVLGLRLRAATEAVMTGPGGSLHEIFGTPDDLKFRSCMTLFACATEQGDMLFCEAMRQLCDGRADEATLGFLGVRPPECCPPDP